MPTPTLSKLPLPKSWEEFELLVRDLYAKEWGDPQTQLNGRRGQRQRGVDVYGQPLLLNGRYAGIQCKRYEDGALTDSLIHDEIGQAEAFRPVLAELTIATTAKRDATLQESVRKISDARRDQHLFPVHIQFWDDLEHLLTHPKNSALMARYYAEWLAALGLPHPGHDDEAHARRYLDWVISSTDAITAPGLELVLSVRMGWAMLEAVLAEDAGSHAEGGERGESIELYHGFAREAEPEQRDREAIQTEYLLELARNAVVVGGPASGKTTLLQRLAHDLAARGRRVVRIRLSSLPRVFAELGHFDSAVAQLAFEGTGVPIEVSRRLLDSVEYLMADGLDECGRDRAKVAELLDTWSAGHPGTVVIASTRPVGHQPHLLSGWQQVHLLSLRLEAVERWAKVLLQARGLQGSDLERELGHFRRHLDDLGTRNMAQQSPLLLDFILALSLEGMAPGTRRAEVYTNVIRLMQQRGNRGLGSGSDLDDATAQRTLDLIGFHTSLKPGLEANALIAGVAAGLKEQLPGISELVAQRDVWTAIHYWEARRVIERLHVGTYETLSFTHLALGEFCAARHAAALDPGALKEWLGSAAHEPRWHEVILLAAGLDSSNQIPKYFLDADSDDDSDSSSLKMAAQSLNEAAEPRALVEEVVRRLKRRVTSTTPASALELIEAALPLAKRLPEAFRPLSHTLCSREEAWLRLASVRLDLAAEGDAVDLEKLIAFVDTSCNIAPWFE